MKWLSFFSILLMFGACTGFDSKAPSGEIPFDTHQFLMDDYTNRVHTFLSKQAETAKKSDYFALFVNTENCSSCTMNAFGSLKAFLQKQQSTFVFINDSRLFRQQDYPNLKFICLPDQVYKKEHIFHGQMYLYAIENKRIKPIKLTIHTIDSLNRL